MNILKFAFFLSAATTCFAASITAGEKPAYSLHGYIGIQGGESFQYDIQITDSAGHVTGYAYTYSDKAHYVKANLEGTLDRQSHTLTLREKSIVTNHQFTSRAIICLINAVLTYDAQEGSLSGPLKSLTADNGNCASGSITFNVAAELTALWQAFPSPDTPAARTPVISKEESRKQPAIASAAAARQAAPKPQASRQNAVTEHTQTAPVATPAEKPKPITQITEGKEVVYQWHNKDIVLEIWDGGTMDYDRVTINYNGTPLLSAYTLEKKKKRITVPVGGNELNIISIEALNEGNEAPNTANITLWDGSISYEVLANNPTGKAALIKIRKAE